MYLLQADSTYLLLLTGGMMTIINVLLVYSLFIIIVTFKQFVHLYNKYYFCLMKSPFTVD